MSAIKAIPEQGQLVKVRRHLYMVIDGLFSNPAWEQFEQNMNSLKARAEQISREIEQETALIRKWFENLTAQLFRW
ncbi:hypothetical protein H6F51_00170 [Cyanobacteria bacterium FACHB-DQ100]|nr:hypothetical protein [Cyanobacteria bacterium FACHB-DQ100]